MPDAYLDWEGDFVVSASGGLLLAEGVDFANQRILRRLLTAIKGYVWHPEYGIGLPQKIGRFANVYTLYALVRSQIALESSVAKSPAPTIGVAEDSANPGLFVISIKYTYAATGEPVTLTFTP